VLFVVKPQTALFIRKEMSLRARRFYRAPALSGSQRRGGNLLLGNVGDCFVKTTRNDIASASCEPECIPREVSCASEAISNLSFYVACEARTSTDYELESSRDAHMNDQTVLQYLNASFYCKLSIPY
jgi:hypothetical protein